MRSHLGWRGGVLDGRFQLNLSGTYSLNLNQPRTQDLNFVPTARFTLADEARPVFVEPTGIVPATGSVAARDARRVPVFAQVSELRSDLESRSTQVSLGLSPIPRGRSRLRWNVNYTYQHLREQVSGFQSTAGDPLRVEWARSAQGPHQLGYTLHYSFFDAVDVSWTGRFSAARPAAPAPPGPPIRSIATASALSVKPLRWIGRVRELPDGRVLVNDIGARRLVLMDTVAVVLDSVSAAPNAYGRAPGTLIPYRADTTLCIDPNSQSMLVLDGRGEIVRVRAVWRTDHLRFFGGFRAESGWLAADARGRIVYPVSTGQPRWRPPTERPRGPALRIEQDSAFLVAADLQTRALDTLAVLRQGKRGVLTRRSDSERGRHETEALNPLPSDDAWAVLPDGTVAVVRALDYRVEYLHPDGRRTSSAKLPFAWQRLADEDKQRLVDSMRTEMARRSAAAYVPMMIYWANLAKQPFPADFQMPAGYRLQAGLPREWKLPPGLSFPADYVYACAAGEEPKLTPPPTPATASTPPPGTQGAAPGRPSCIPAPTLRAGFVPPKPTREQFEMPLLLAAELPDYRPPFAGDGAVQADAVGNLWIQTTTARPAPGGDVYDIIDRSGELVDRLQLPRGYELVGFGAGRVVYLAMRDASGMRLARVRLK